MSNISKSGMLSLYDVLKGEHREVSGMLKALSMMPNRADDSAREVFMKIRNELLSHAHAEQETVYKRLEEKNPDSRNVHEAVNEHQTVENLLNELQQMPFGTEDWDRKLDELKNNVEHHADEEESVLFDQMKSSFSGDEEKEIRDQFVEKKNQKLETLKAAS